MNRKVWWVPLALMLLTGVQSGLRREGLSPWSGGGMAMFSTLDRILHRGILVEVDGVPVPVDSAHHMAALHARAFPSEAALHALGAAVAGEQPYRVEAFALRFATSHDGIDMTRAFLNSVSRP